MKIKAPTPPKPTEIKHDRMRCGQRKSRTVAEIDHDMKFQVEMARKNLSPIIE